MNSDAQQASRVPFPEFTGERVYMRKFVDGVLPPDLARWQRTVSAMLDGVRYSGVGYLMVDQGVVSAGTTHRRPGPHVDMYWDDGIRCHGESVPATHHPLPTQPPQHRAWAPRHSALPLPGRHLPVPTPGHVGSPLGRHCQSQDAREALVLASDVAGCLSYTGEWSGVIGDGGDCSGVDLDGLVQSVVKPGYAWIGETGSWLHESIPVERTCKRTVVRLNLKGWTQ